MSTEHDKVKGKRIRRNVGLTKEASGVTGELQVAYTLARCGFKVAKPYWTDDEVDLLVLVPVTNMSHQMPVPIQAKSIQQRVAKKAGMAQTGYVQNLKKRYVDAQHSRGLCLAIYCPQTGKLWFIEGAENIRQAYEETTGKKWAALKGDSAAVSIKVDLSDAGNKAFDKAWLVDKGKGKFSPKKLADKVNAVVRAVTGYEDRKAQYGGLTLGMMAEHDARHAEETLDALKE